MTDSMERFADLITVAEGFKPSVQLPVDFENPETNARLVASYIPTSQSIDLLAEIARSLSPNSTERARMLVGTFGTGKSDLLLMIGNYFAQAVDSPLMQPLYARLRDINANQAETIATWRSAKAPFLVVMLQADTVTPFPGFILHGLDQALNRAGLADLMGPTKYKSASEQIMTWEREQHPRLNDFRELLRTREVKELSGLVAELAGPQADHAFKIFERTFNSVTGSNFNIYGYSQPHETYAQVAKALCEHGSYSGIVVICDEFTEFLRRFERAIDQQAAEIDSETKAVENLAERSATSGRTPIHFIVASLEGFASASERSGTGQASRAVEKSGGRFKQHSLEVQNSEELIRGVIQRSAKGRDFRYANRQRDELMDSAYTIWKNERRDREWVRTTIVDGAFPLHPFTTRALPLLNRKVAQTQRTMFQFLTSDEGLSGFLKRASLGSGYADWVNLVTLEHLFDYFRVSIAEKRPDITEAFDNAVQRLHAATVDWTLAERILKVVTVCEVITDTALSPTRRFLRQALNLPESAHDDVGAALDLLERMEALYPPSETDSDTTGIYSLPMVGRTSSTSLRQKINQIAQQLPTSVTRLQTKHPPDAIKAVSYNNTHGTHREFATFFVGMEALQSPARKEITDPLLPPSRLKSDLKDVRDGLLWYVVATNESEQATARSAAREWTKKYPNIVIGVPTVELSILTAQRNYEALLLVRDNPQTDPAAKPFLQDGGQVGKSYRTALDAALVRLRDPKNWEWFADGTQRAFSLPDLTSQLMEKIFPHTPVHHLAQQIKADGYPTAIANAAQLVLKGDIRLDMSAKTENNLLRSAVVELGLLQSQGKEGAFEKFALVEPSNAAPKSRLVWQIMQKHLADQKPWADLVDKLRRPPYGMYDSLLLLFVVAFVQRNADSLEVTDTSQKTRGSAVVDIGLIKRMLADPHAITVRYHPLTDAETQWLRGLADLNVTKQTEQAGTLKVVVSNQITDWLKRLRLPVLAESLPSGILPGFYPESDPQTLSVLNLLLQTKDIAAHVLTDIPQTLGLPADPTVWTETGVQTALTAMREVFAEAKQLGDHLKKHAIRRVAAVFGSDQATTTHLWDDIYRWRHHRKVVQVGNLSPYPRTLFNLTNNPSGSIEQVLLDEFARGIVGIGTDYTHWSSLDRLDRLEDELRKAKDVIDTAWSNAAPAEEVWLGGLARAASGRETSGVAKSEAVAQALAAWTSSIAWPACTRALDATRLGRVYPNLDPAQTADLAQILARSSFEAEHWEAELLDGLPKQFGVGSWRRDEVAQALARFAATMRVAVTFEATWREFCFNELLESFEPVDNTQPPAQRLAAWNAAYPIPADNDLSAESKIVLAHLRDGAANPTTTLLITLPRALPTIGQSYQQWSDFATFEAYRSTVDRAVREITTYQPLTDAEYQWLVGIVRHGLQHPLAVAFHEQQRLVRIVYPSITEWRDKQNLPNFVLSLRDDDLRHLFPAATASTNATAHLLLHTHESHLEAMTRLLLIELPHALGLVGPSKEWQTADVQAALADLGAACGLVTQLPTQLKAQMYSDIGAAFGLAPAHSASSDVLERSLNEWRTQYVLLPDEQLSRHTRTVFEMLQRINGDLAGMILTALPKNLREINAPYGQWATWDTRHVYLATLREAVAEIIAKGTVKDATPKAQHIWGEFKAGLTSLSADERRWLIKKVQDELRA